MNCEINTNIVASVEKNNNSTKKKKFAHKLYNSHDMMLII